MKEGREQRKEDQQTKKQRIPVVASNGTDTMKKSKLKVLHLSAAYAALGRPSSEM